MLLHEDVEWVWDEKCQMAFETLQRKLLQQPILALPDNDRPFTVHTDFSHTSIAAILEQLQADGKQHVISYASRHCSAAESKLGPTDGELLAIVYAVEKFHCYIAGTHFLVTTDHAALVHLNEAKTRNAKLARWAMKLASYDFTIKHRPGRVHDNADGLSRAHQAAAADTPAPDECWIEEVADDVELLIDALESFGGDADVDGTPHPHLPADAIPTPEAILGPR